MVSPTAIVPVFAENFNSPGWGIAMVGIPVLVLFMCFAAIAVNVDVGRRRWWGLVPGLITAGIGWMILSFWFPDSSRDITAHPIFFSCISIPLLCGIVSLLLWLRPRQD